MLCFPFLLALQAVCWVHGRERLESSLGISRAPPIGSAMPALLMRGPVGWQQELVLQMFCSLPVSACLAVLGLRGYAELLDIQAAALH